MLHYGVRIPKELEEKINDLCKVMKMKKTNLVGLAVEKLIQKDAIDLEDKHLIKRGREGYVVRQGRIQFYLEEELIDTIERIALQHHVKPVVIYWYALEEYVKYMLKE